MSDKDAVAQLLAALACGERLALKRAHDDIELAPDERSRRQQTDIANQEEANYELVAARLHEVGGDPMIERFMPYFEAFHTACAPSNWVEAQTLHYAGDALVSEFAEFLAGKLDPVSAEVVHATLSERDDQEAFALTELQRAMDADPAARAQIAAYARRISGEALTQTKRALDSAQALRDLLGGFSGEKELLLDLLERHRARLDRLGIDLLDDDDDEL